MLFTKFLFINSVGFIIGLLLLYIIFFRNLAFACHNLIVRRS